MARSVASLAVSIVARTAKFRKGMKRAQRAVNRFSDGVAKMAARTARMSAALGAAALGGIALLVKSQSRLIDETAKMSDRLGIGTEKIVALQHASKLAGVTVNTLGMGLQRFTRRLSEAAGGGGEAVKAFEELRFTTEDLAKLAKRPGDALAAVAKRLGQVKLASDRLRISFKLFDAEGARIGTNVLPALVKGFGSLQRETLALGLSFNRVQARKVEQMSDAFTRLQATIAGAGRVTSINFAALLENMATNTDKFARHFTNSIVEGFQITTLTAAGTADQIQRSFKFAFRGIEAGQLLLIRNMTSNVLLAVRSFQAVTAPLFENAKFGALLFGSKRAFEAVRAIEKPFEFNKLQAFTAGLTARLSEISDELKAVGKAAPLSDRLFRWFQDIENKSHKAALSVIGLQGALAGGKMPTMPGLATAGLGGAGGPGQFQTIDLSRQSLRNFPGQKAVQKVEDTGVTRRLDMLINVMRDQDRTAIFGR